MQYKKYFLPRYFLRPSKGEKIPIQILDFKRLYGAWVPELKSSIYFDGLPVSEVSEVSEVSDFSEISEVSKESDFPEAEGLKRVRKVRLLRVYDWFKEREGVIELSEDEFKEFERVYNEFLLKCGEILYSRKKIGRKTENLFELKEKPYLVREVKKGIFSDKL